MVGVSGNFSIDQISITTSPEESEEFQDIENQSSTSSTKAMDMQALEQRILQLEQQLAQASAGSSQAQQASNRLNGVKIEKPQIFKGDSQDNTVDAFIFQCELFFNCSALTDSIKQASLASLLLGGDAAVWLRSKYDLNTISQLTWSELRDALRTQFRPADWARRARDQLDSCKQNASVAAYTTYFRRILVQCKDVSDNEALYRYCRGLKASIRPFVLIQEPSTFEEAAVAAERVSIGDSRGTVHRTHHNSAGGTGSQQYNGPAPMQVDNLTGQQPKQGNRGDKKCYYCGKVGHFKRECRKWKQDNNSGQGRVNAMGKTDGDKGKESATGESSEN